MQKDRVLFYSNHFKRCRFFEDTVNRIADAGYPWVILLTGSNGPFRECKVDHPLVTIIQTNQTSYDAGMMLFKQHGLLTKTQADLFVHIDNDCFLNGINELEEYLDEFDKDGYDYACHLVGHISSDKYQTKGHIAHVYDQKMIPAADVPTPEPHYENAYQVIRASAYNKLSIHDVGHHRRFLNALHCNNAKMGSHKANYQWDYTNWGKEWFHVGHIMEKFIQLEAGNTQAILKYNSESEFDIFRAGFFLAQEEIYGDIYPNSFKDSLKLFTDHMGGKNKLLDCWTKYTQGTCMEHWKPYCKEKN